MVKKSSHLLNGLQPPVHRPRAPKRPSIFAWPLARWATTTFWQRKPQHSNYCGIRSRASFSSLPFTISEAWRQNPIGLSAAHLKKTRRRLFTEAHSNALAHWPDLLSPSPTEDGACLPTSRISPPAQEGPGGFVSSV